MTTAQPLRVLITGGGGMVGRNLREHALAACYELLTPTSRELDLRDRQATATWMRRERPDAIIHVAGVVGGIQANINEPVRFLVDNLDIALSVLTGAREAGVQTVLNLTSSCMYPKDHAETLAIDDLLAGPLEPTNEGYALAKIASWKLASYMTRETPHLIYRTLVPCNLYGRYDSFDAIRSHLVPAAIRKVSEAVQAGRDEVPIWGDGTARREFMYAADLAEFIWTFLPRASELPDVMNVGVGRDHSVTEYYEAVAAQLGYRGRFVYDPSKPTGMQRKLLEVSQQTELGWSPSTSLEKGLAETIEFFTGQ